MWTQNKNFVNIEIQVEKANQILRLISGSYKYIDGEILKKFVYCFGKKDST